MSMYSTIRKNYKLYLNHALFYCHYTSVMPVSLTAWLSVKMYTTVEHDFSTTSRPLLLGRKKGWSLKTGSTVVETVYFLVAV